ncbi:RNA polymerase II C-terminal domain phosphatase-like 1 isoform X2 [Phoenix dactylifera]|uniref:protein-serine/threonine phosphatase n=1 Tax=Phoenix dactylifera TaxID=42345 RepID=A0A8B9AFS4_PHODC|nr:RNA polymerase II C-terminal domain phosphatase-like 1 isoform X2 [Phoenix dactylifera]
MFKSAVYHGNSLIGEAEIFPQNSNPGAWVREIRISHFSPSSERCLPLAVLHTIASGGVSFKMESRSPPSDESPLCSLHAACLRENKTAVIPLGGEELHLVAMNSGKNLMHHACFWGFNVASGLYNSCLGMLNLRCLGIVFDLDETLIVANTLRSFEDRIDALQRKLSNETDPQRVTGMLAEIKRYQDDKSILKQYAENDQVVENGKVYKVQSEVVPPLSDSHQLITRPVIRLQEKNIILTRVNPLIRDTSVLVRLRPAWEELRSYLIARGRKRFEVYVCTMAERDYALEMWRLLDPDSSLISSIQLLDRIVCVKSGSRKSLLSVFQDGICHPKMALVIDDRLKVWDEKDQPRVHVVPAFAPYYAPQAEANGNVPVLCVARNVACNVRGGFFKEFDEGLLPRISDSFYEDEWKDFPSAPDVGNYLISEDDNATSNGNKDQLCFEGMTDAEVERRLKAIHPMVNNFDPRSVSSIQHVMASSSAALPQTATQAMMPLPNNNCPQPIALGRPLVCQSGLPEPSLQGSPAREEGEVPESELDPDTRRRLLILQHGQDTRDPTPSFTVRSPLHVAVPPVQSRGNWFPLEEEMNPRQLSREPKEFTLEPETIRFNKKRPNHQSYFRSGENSISSDRVLHENRGLPMQLHQGDDRLRPNHAAANYNSFPGEEMPAGLISSSHKDTQFESGRATARYAETPAGVLQNIAMKCGAKVEFRTALCDTTNLQFSMEVWFVGGKLGEGIGKTRKEAQQQAAEISLRTLANKYLSNARSDPSTLHGDMLKPFHIKENGFTSDLNSFGYPACARDDVLPVASTSEESRLMDQRLEGPNKTAAAVAALKDLCTIKGFNLVFQAQSSPSAGSVSKGEVYAQVEVAGQILGKGVGTTWEEAKLQAAEEALGALKSMLGQFTQKHSGSPRSLSATPNKRLKADFSRLLQRIPSSGRYSRNETPVP